MSKWGLLLQRSNWPNLTNTPIDFLKQSIVIVLNVCPLMIDIAPSDFVTYMVRPDAFTLKFSLSDKRAEWKT